MKKDMTFKEKMTEKVYRADDKKINLITYIIDFITLVIFILTLILKTEKMYALYWLFISILFIIDLISIIHWDADGLKLDKKESDKIIRSYRDLTTITVVLSGICYLSVMFLEMINESIKSNVYVIIIAFILISSSHIFNRLFIYNSIQNTKKLVEDLYNKNTRKEKTNGNK